MNKIESKSKEVKTGENPNCDVSLVGCYLLKAGIGGKEKEQIKEKVFEVIMANRENSRQQLIKEILDRIKEEKEKGFEARTILEGLEANLSVIEMGYPYISEMERLIKELEDWMIEDRYYEKEEILNKLNKIK